ncbi:unnamed protein product, partial [Ectocarpus sp. 13 AM-2016]
AGLNGTGAETTIGEVHRGSRWGGDFALSIGGLEGSALPFDARAEEMQEAVSALLASAGGENDENSVEVWREDYEAGFRWIAAFYGGNLDGDIDLMEVAWSALHGTEGSVQVYRLTNGAHSAGGTFTLAFNGDVSEPILWNASATSVEQALESLPQVGDVTVVAETLQKSDATVDQNSSETAVSWTVEFTTVGTPANIGDLPLLEADGSFLTGTTVGVRVEEISAGCCEVEVSANGGADYTSTGSDGTGSITTAAFRYQDRATVRSVTPSSGPASGGTAVVLYGTGFDLPSTSDNDTHVGDFVCVFGGRLESPAARLNSTTVTCASPFTHLRETGAMSVSVRWPALVSPSTTTAAFTFHEDVTLQALSPRRGSNVGVYTTAVFIGRGSFAAVGIADVSCVIEVRLPSNITGGYTALTYSAPAVELSSSLHTAEVTAFSNKEGYGCGMPSLEHFFPGVSIEDWVDNDWGAIALVSLSGNGGVDLTAPLTFTYFPKPVVVAALPGAGVDGGGTSVVVHGTWFSPPKGGYDESELYCRFGLAPPAPAQHISDSAVSCTSSSHTNVAAIVSVEVESARVFHATQEVLLRIPSPMTSQPNASSHYSGSGTWTLALEDYSTVSMGANVTAGEMATALSALQNIGIATVSAEYRALSDPYADLQLKSSEDTAVDGLDQDVFGFPVLAPEVSVNIAEWGHDGDGIVREVQVLRTNRSTLVEEVQTVTNLAPSNLRLTGRQPLPRQVQVVTLAANEALSGEFTVTYPDVGSTEPLAHDVSAEAFASAIRALDPDDIGGAGVTVSRSRTGVRGYAWTVTFDDLGAGDRPQLVATADASLKTRTTSGTLSLEVETMTDGVAGIGGTFEISF